MENIEHYLILWAKRISRENIGIGYRSTTTEWKLWKVGGGGHMVLRMPNYWPDSRLIALNEAITHLPFKLRKPLIGRYLLGYSTRRLGRLCNCSHTQVRRYIDEAKQRLEVSCIF